jgi:hypothetical protein
MYYVLCIMYYVLCIMYYVLCILGYKYSIRELHNIQKYELLLESQNKMLGEISLLLDNILFKREENMKTLKDLKKETENIKCVIIDYKELIYDIKNGTYDNEKYVCSVTINGVNYDVTDNFSYSYEDSDEYKKKMKILNNKEKECIIKIKKLERKHALLTMKNIRIKSIGLNSIIENVTPDVFTMICNNLEKKDIDVLCVVSKKIYMKCLKYKMLNYWLNVRKVKNDCNITNIIGTEYMKFHKVDLYKCHVNGIKQMLINNKEIRYVSLYTNLEEHLNYLINGSTHLVSLELSIHSNLDLKFNVDFKRMTIKFPALEILMLDGHIDQSIDALAGSFPQLKKLILDGKFNQNIDALAGSFPNLEKLVLGGEFNQNIDALSRSFPNLKELEFGDYFESSVDSLVNSFKKLTILTFNYKNNIDVLSNSFPKLENLYLGKRIFNCIITLNSKDPLIYEFKNIQSEINNIKNIISNELDIIFDEYNKEIAKYSDSIKNHLDVDCINRIQTSWADNKKIPIYMKNYVDTLKNELEKINLELEDGLIDSEDDLIER